MSASNLDSEATPPSRHRRHRLPWLNHRAGWSLHHLLVAVVLIPAGLAALGAVVEAALYRPGFEPRFHVLWLPIAGWIAAPFVLLRTFWRWPRYVPHLELAIYVVQSVGYFAAVAYTVIVGREYYVVNAGIRDLLQKAPAMAGGAGGGGDLFTPIATPEQVWTWLEHVVGTVYSSDAGRGLLSRTIPPTRLMMLTSLKLRQHRVRPVCCSEFNRALFPEGSRRCYPMFDAAHESREAYGAGGGGLRFAYSDLTTPVATGHDLDPGTFAVAGKFADYPLAGFSTFFAPGVRRATALGQLRAMRAAGWLDARTRAVVVELALTTPDFLDDAVWAAATFLLERDKIGRFTASPPSVFLSHFAYTEVALGLRGGAPLESCGNGSALPADVDLDSVAAVNASLGAPTGVRCGGAQPGEYMLRFYQGVVPVVVYTVFLAVRGLCADWRRHLRGPFNWTAALWSALLLVVWAYQLRGFRLLRCSYRLAPQPPFAGLAPDSAEGLLSRLPPKTDYLPFAHAETQGRRFLAISIFVHVFGSLRFLVRLKALGVLVRTLWFAAASLLSFSLSFLVVFLGFAVMFFYVFSVDAREFSDIPSTITTLWLGMLGEVQLSDELYRARDWTIGLYIVFTFVSAFVLLTLIISIVSNAHDRAQREASEEGADDVAAGAGDGGGRSGGAAVAKTTPRRRRPGALASGDLTRLVSEGDVLSSAVRGWRRAAIRRRRSRTVAPGDFDRPIIALDDDDDDESAAVGRRSVTEMKEATASAADAARRRAAFRASPSADDDVAEQKV